MIKLIILFLVFISVEIKAETRPGFAGCGEYLLKGTLQKNTKDKSKLGLFLYKTNVKTNSEMQFVIKASNDIVLIASYLDAPTEIRAQINTLMDGTRGEIAHISKVSLRRPNPLEPLKDSGIFLINSKACEGK